jgi:dienelactone hydrolase
MSSSDVTNVKAAVQMHHGTADESVAYAESVATETHLRRQRTPVELLPYLDRRHGFFGGTGSAADRQAASLAWNRTLAFLTRRLNG